MSTISTSGISPNQTINPQQLERIKSFQQRYQALSQELGSIELEKIALEARRKAAEQYLTSLQQEERSIAEEIEQQLGKGTINLELGEFTPYEEK